MIRTPRSIGLLVAGVTAVVVLPFTAFGDTAVGFTEQADAGTVVLSTSDNTLTVTYDDGTGSTPVSVSQATQRNDCRVRNTGAGNGGPLAGVLTIAAEDAAGAATGIGLVSNGLGSAESRNCSTGNGRIEPGQKLRLTFDLPDDVAVDRAVLDVEGKFGARLAVTGSLGGTAVTGLTATPDLAEGGSDNGADAGATDNTRVTVGSTAPGDDFDSLTLAIAGDRGAISLEGGGDHVYPTDNRTTFHLVRSTDYEFRLSCGGTLDSDDDTTFGDSESGAEGYVVHRYDVDEDPEDDVPCEDIGADLSSDGDGVLFRKTTTGGSGAEQDPTLRLTLTWHVPLYETDGETPRPTADVEAELAREIDLLDDEGLAPVQFCLGDNDTDAGPASADRPDGVPWCLLDETIEVRDGYLVQTQVYDGAGDPRWL